MRIFLTVLILIFGLQSWTQADDIRDFEIEVISIGDSLLDFYSEKEIKQNIQVNYFSRIKDKTFITTEIKILFKSPSKFSKPLAKIDKGRLLMVKECKDNWCNVKTGKFSGWIEKGNVWGFIN